jgi:hypothetical protein
MSGNEKNRSPDKQSPPDGAVSKKRAYVKPAFQHEKVFETMALACGKLSSTQRQCRFNRKNS